MPQPIEGNSEAVGQLEGYRQSRIAWIDFSIFKLRQPALRYSCTGAQFAPVNVQGDYPFPEVQDTGFLDNLCTGNCGAFGGFSHRPTVRNRLTHFLLVPFNQEVDFLLDKLH